MTTEGVRRRLRGMRWWDIPAVMALEEELFGAERWSEAMFWSELAEHDTRHYVVAIDGDPGSERIIGYAGLCAYTGEAYVQTIGVTGAAQGRGVGAWLLTELLDEAVRRGEPTVVLEVRADNGRAQELYRRFGFVAIGRRRGYYQPSNTDAVVMALHDPAGQLTAMRSAAS